MSIPRARRWTEPQTQLAIEPRSGPVIVTIAYRIREEDIDAVTALSGSGPAYFFLLTEALREAGEKLGLDRDTAARLALHTFAGSAQMAATEGARDVVELRSQVTSKGGTTEAAVKSLEAAGLRRSFDEALAAAANRSRELGDLLDAQS